MADKIGTGGGDRRVYDRTLPGGGYQISESHFARDRRIGPVERRRKDWETARFYLDTVSTGWGAQVVLDLRRPSHDGDTISREQAIAALSSLYGYDENHPDIAPAIEEILSLPSIAPDAVEAEYREAAVAWAEAYHGGTNIEAADAYQRFRAARSRGEGVKP